MIAIHFFETKVEIKERFQATPYTNWFIHGENSYKPWDIDEEQILKTNFNSQMSIKNIANKLQRSKGAIRSRLRKLGLIE